MGFKEFLRSHIDTLLNANSIEPDCPMIPFLIKDLFFKDTHSEYMEKLRLIEEKRKRVELERLQIIRSKMPNAVAFSDRFSLLKFATEKARVSGEYAEFGVYMGRSINYLADILQHEIHGFDSFQGLPENWRKGLAKGSFSVENASNLAFKENVRLWIGLFEESIPKFIDFSDVHRMAFLHIDCDLYSSTVTVFKKLGPYIGSGTVIVFDEYFGYEGWREGEYKAFREFARETQIDFEYIGFNPFGEQVAIMIK